MQRVVYLVALRSILATVMAAATTIQEAAPEVGLSQHVFVGPNVWVAC